MVPSALSPASAPPPQAVAARPAASAAAAARRRRRENDVFIVSPGGVTWLVGEATVRQVDELPQEERDALGRRPDQTAPRLRAGQAGVAEDAGLAQLVVGLREVDARVGAAHLPGGRQVRKRGAAPGQA